MHTKFERLLSKSLTTLEVMTHYLVVHTGPGGLELSKGKLPKRGHATLTKYGVSSFLWLPFL